MLAPGGKLGRERSPFGSKHIGSLQGMRKARKIGGLVENLDANQATASGQGKLGKASPMVKRHMTLSPRGVPLQVQSAGIGADGEDEACPEGMRRAQEIAEIHGL